MTDQRGKEILWGRSEGIGSNLKNTNKKKRNVSFNGVLWLCNDMNSIKISFSWRKFALSYGRTRAPRSDQSVES